MRIDKYLSEQFGSRTKSERAICDGLVLVNGKTVSPSYDLKPDDKVEILEAKENYVSLGGFKLAKALREFSSNVKDKIFVDVGASNGGFTDCLLQNGAKKVYCVDVGESQLEKSIPRDKVVVIDNFNARNLNLQMFPEPIDGVVIDVSFISLTYILQAVADILKSGGEVYALIKPQFECESRSVGKNGIVRDKNTRIDIVRKIYNYSVEVGLAPQKLTTAPIVKNKNIEFILYMVKSSTPKPINLIIESIK